MSQEAKQADSNALVWLIAIGALAFAVYSPEFFIKNFYVNIWRTVKVWELWLVNNTLGFALGWWSWFAEPLSLYQQRLAHIDRLDLTWRHARDTEMMTMSRYGFIPMLALAAYGIKTFLIKIECRGALGLEELIEVQSRTFRFNRHLVVHNPLKDPRLDVTRGKYAMRLKPLDLALRDGFITLDPSVTDRDDKRYLFHEDVFVAKSTERMGKPFTRSQDLSQTERWLVAAFLTFLDGDTNNYHRMLGDFSEVFYYEETSKRKAKKLIAKINAECDGIIKRVESPPPLIQELKDVLQDNSFGDDVAIVTRDAFKVLAKHKGIGDSLKILGKHFKEEYKTLTAKKYESPTDYLAYEDAEYLPLSYKAFLASGIMEARGRGKEAASMANELVAYLKHETLTVNEDMAMAEIIAKYEVLIISQMEQTPSDIFENAKRKHFYTHGVIARLFRECGNLGVVTAARFTWLQLVDRRLFLVLDDEGMPEGSAEITFSRAHFDQEIGAGRRLKRPEVHQQIEEYKKRLLERVNIV